MSSVEVIECESADEILDRLSAREPMWQPRPRNWLFRGHSDAGWPLIPSALRPQTILGFGEHAAVGPRRTHLEQVRDEFAAVERFLVLMNEVGHAVPPDIYGIWFNWKEVHDDVISTARKGYSQWPLHKLYTLLALAQHHGIPTRLLDWSRNGKVAAYFASEEAAHWVKDGAPGGDAPERLAVWAFNEYEARKLWRNSSTSVASIGTPQASNQNLRAQRGVFTVHVQETADANAAPIIAALDKIVPEQAAVISETNGAAPIAGPILRKLSLPVTEAPKMLRLLYYEAITRASLFPSLDGVVQSLDLMRYWDRM